MTTNTTLHHVYDTDITVTSLLTNDGTLAISGPRASEEEEILAQVSFINEVNQGMGGNPKVINFYSHQPTSSHQPTTLNQQAPNDECDSSTIIDAISAPTNTELPYSIKLSNDTNYNVINIYSASNQGLGYAINSIHACFSCLTDDIGIVNVHETTTIMMAIMSGAVNIRNWQKLGPSLQDYQYYQAVKTSLIKLSTSTSPPHEYMQHCKWESLPSNTSIVTFISNLNSCTNLVLDYEKVVQDSQSLSQVPSNLINFLQRHLHSNVVTVPIPNLDQRTILHLPSMTSNIIIHVANCYRQFVKYATQPTHGNLLQRWTSADIVPVQDADSEFSFTDIVASVYNHSTLGFDKLTKHLFDVIKLYQISCIKNTFPAELISTIRQLTLLLEWMCQQVTLVSILQDRDAEPMFLVVKTHTMYHRYDYFLVIFLTMLDATTSLVVPEMSSSRYKVPSVAPPIIQDMAIDQYMVEDDTDAYTVQSMDSDL
jgi:hypothetical protein